MAKRILFICNTNQPFVKIDLSILKEQWDVKERFERSPRQLNPIAIAWAVKNCDLVFGWFASWHSFLPVLLARIMKKPSVVIIGGYDTANQPDANYGSQRGGVRRWLARTIIGQATRLIVNSHYTYQEAIDNAGADPQKLSIIYHGLDAWPMGEDRREKIVLTVGGLWHENLLRKGLLPFVQSAKYLPEAQFILVGKSYDDSIDILRDHAPNNVEFKGYVPDGELEQLYMKSSVYVQASVHEGFGLSVAEAMTAGCIPVVTRAGALPEVVGDSGIFAGSNAAEDIASAIRNALDVDISARYRAREHVINTFPLEKRRQALFTLISNLI